MSTANMSRIQHSAFVEQLYSRCKSAAFITAFNRAQERMMSAHCAACSSPNHCSGLPGELEKICCDALRPWRKYYQHPECLKVEANLDLCICFLNLRVCLFDYLQCNNCHSWAGKTSKPLLNQTFQWLRHW